MTDRVLDQRLQQQRRDDRGCGAWIDAERHAQPVAEARFLNRDVVIEQLELLLECDEGPAVPVERLPQQLREPGDHPVRLLRVLEHESRNRVERIEEEVRLQLSDEGIEARLHELHLEARRAPGVVQPGDHRVDEQVERPPQPNPVPHTREEGVGCPPQAERPFQPALEARASNRREQRHRNVGGNDERGTANAYCPSGKGAHRRRKQRPGPPSRELPREDPAPGTRLSARRGLEMHLDREEQRHRGPGAPNDQNTLHEPHCSMIRNRGQTRGGDLLSAIVRIV